MKEKEEETRRLKWENEDLRRRIEETRNKSKAMLEKVDKELLKVMERNTLSSFCCYCFG